ncbi:MAG: phosphate ABC transporter permease PstA [Anaerolineales bacterium]|nr:phosphate ABC transporter permease PstA [Anaerolineales bacterium]
MNRNIFSNNAQEGEQFKSNLATRHRWGRLWLLVFRASTLVGIIALALLLINITNSAFGYAIIVNQVKPEDLAINGISIEQLHQVDLVYILEQNLSRGIYRKLDAEAPLAERERKEIYELVIELVVEPTVIHTWPLLDSLFKRSQVFAEVPAILAEEAKINPQLNTEAYEVKMISWLDRDFLGSPQNSDPEKAGVRTAILGSLWIIAITILVAFPIGVSAAIYLEEYAQDSWLNRLIRTNINNLAGVPSIIYGILGLSVFVRAMEHFTSGALFGLVDPTTANGRTILSAAFTLGLLVLPLIIINAQEAIRAVPNSLRQASFGMGATRWQTVWHHVLPNAMPGILTGTILSVSRALGETAPLIVVGASTYITFDPEGPFSKFTTLPIQIYQWTARPQDEYRNIAAAAILVLLTMLLTLNATAILLRNRFSKRQRL